MKLRFQNPLSLEVWKHAPLVEYIFGKGNYYLIGEQTCMFQKASLCPTFLRLENPVSHDG